MIPIADCVCLCLCPCAVIFEVFFFAVATKPTHFLLLGLQSALRSKQDAHTGCSLQPGSGPLLAKEPSEAQGCVEAQCLIGQRLKRNTGTGTNSGCSQWLWLISCANQQAVSADIIGRATLPPQHGRFLPDPPVALQPGPPLKFSRLLHSFSRSPSSPSPSISLSPNRQIHQTDPIELASSAARLDPLVLPSINPANFIFSLPLPPDARISAFDATRICSTTRPTR